jgi:hypothetical protein
LQRRTIAARRTEDRVRRRATGIIQDQIDQEARQIAPYVSGTEQAMDRAIESALPPGVRARARRAIEQTARVRDRLQSAGRRAGERGRRLLGRIVRLK